jgi:hypothetical protein
MVQSNAPDEFFTPEQQARLAGLMARWRRARDTGVAFPTADQAELDALIDAELKAAANRAAALIRSTVSRIRTTSSTSILARFAD